MKRSTEKKIQFRQEAGGGGEGRGGKTSKTMKQKLELRFKGQRIQVLEWSVQGELLMEMSSSVIGLCLESSRAKEIRMKLLKSMVGAFPM